MSQLVKRCINLDWLEVYCLEPKGMPRTPEYFEALGYTVRVRSYGTPQYRQMFTIYDGDFPQIEIRRDPYSLRSQGGIFLPNATHIRLSNRACYMVEPVNFLRRFLLAHAYAYQSISRIDIALDFHTFDSKITPQHFIRLYMQGQIAKINQCNIAAHGSDQWDARSWNSLKWGAPTSNITTKLYNKTLELSQVHDKFYIRDAWQEAGLDPRKDVWRIEFSINSQGQSLQNKQTGEYIRKHLSAYDTREKLLYNWEILAQKYFHFKEVIGNKRKDRCPDVTTIRIVTPWAEVYRPSRNPAKSKEPSRTDFLLAKRLKQIAEDIQEDRQIRESARQLACIMIERGRMKIHVNHIEAERDFLRQEINYDIINHQAERYREKEISLLKILLQKYGNPFTVDCPF